MDVGACVNVVITEHVGRGDETGLNTGPGGLPQQRESRGG